MFTLASFTVAIAAVSSVSGLVVPRATPPAGWATTYLERYDTYHTRYLALGCEKKHNTPFFDQCCHPLLANQKLETRPKQCIPSTSTSLSPSTVEPTATATPDDDGEFDDCDGDDDEPSSTAVATSTKAPVPTSTKVPLPTSTKIPATTSTKVHVTSTPDKTSTTRVSPTPQAGNVNAGGFATFFYQNGVAGACGTVHSDNDLIAAIDGRRYGNLSVKSALCGKKVKISNPANGKSVTVTIADACPTCKNSNSIDLSLAAFQKIATLDQGLVGITWNFV
ncbi:putative lytic transglycolase [Lyophyllum shimeji]|uniref:Lytic transglycolase n=1 Tax=Lyophyllum shimeji TaxID=47721 RepID=A0A9P3PFC8_LYOSH|nr:putative lytic transglycolase [Lyophyllum shimeji]